MLASIETSNEAAENRQEKSPGFVRPPRGHPLDPIVSLVPGRNLLAQPLLLFPELGCEFLAEVLCLEHLAEFDFGIVERRSLEPLDCLFLGPHLPEPEACNQLLGLGKWAIDDRALLAGELDPGTLGACLEPFTREHYA